MDGEFAHGCLICRGKGKIIISIDGQSNLPSDCQNCDASGRVNRETFMRQMTHPMLKYVNNLEIIKLYEQCN